MANFSETIGGAPTYGTVYSVDASGRHQVIHRFHAGVDGAGPRAGLAVLGDTLYGVTFVGGGEGCAYGKGCGTIFSITQAGRERLVYRFSSGAEGSNPYEHLLAHDGFLYGTSSRGGTCPVASIGCGTVFRVSASGSLDVLYVFSGGSDGAVPQGELIYYNGALYGTTFVGGAYNGGTVYRIAQ